MRRKNAARILEAVATPMGYPADRETAAHRAYLDIRTPYWK